MNGKTSNIVFCCPFSGLPWDASRQVQNGISKICLIRLQLFLSTFFSAKSSQPSFSILFRKQKSMENDVPHFFKNHSTCKYVHNYIYQIISVYREFRKMCGTQYFNFADNPFRSPGCYRGITYHFICAFYLFPLFHRRCYRSNEISLSERWQSIVYRLLMILERKKFGFFVWPTLNLAAFCRISLKLTSFLHIIGINSWLHDSDDCEVVKKMQQPCVIQQHI